MKSTLVRPLAVLFIQLALLWNFVFPNDHFYDKMFSFFDESHVRNDLNYTVFLVMKRLQAMSGVHIRCMRYTWNLFICIYLDFT